MVQQSPTDPGFVQDPYPFYTRLRAMGDFVAWDEFGIPMATTSAAVNAVLRHPKLGRAVPEDRRVAVPDRLRPFQDIEDHSLLELEAPTHTRLRKLVLKAFTRNTVLALSPDIRAMAGTLIEGFPSGPFDLLDAYARPVPVQVIARLLGVPQEMAPQLLAWSNAMVAMYQARRNRAVEDAAARASAEFAVYVRDLIRERRQTLGDDLLSQLVAAETDGQKLTADEVVSTTILLLNAGHEATVHSLGNAVRHLADFPKRDQVLAPDHVEGTVEECLRFDPPLHMFRRWVYEDVTILGTTFRKGDEIGCLLGSACRDEAVWPDADIFDPFRPVRPNAAFGAGVHFCVGAPLARLEMQIALPHLFERCPNLHLAAPPRVADLYPFRGLDRLTVTV